MGGCDECPVCLDAFGSGPSTKVFPFACEHGAHAICRKCDRTLFVRHDDRCPTCRAQRTGASIREGGYRPQAPLADRAPNEGWEHALPPQLLGAMPGVMPVPPYENETEAQRAVRLIDAVHTWMPRRIGRGTRLGLGLGLGLFGPPAISSGAGAYGGPNGDLWGMQRHALGNLSSLLEPNDPLDSVDYTSDDDAWLHAERVDSDADVMLHEAWLQERRFRHGPTPARAHSDEAVALAAVTNDRSLREAVEGLRNVPEIGARAYARRMRQSR